MTLDGFVAVACDGSLPQGGDWNLLPSPLELMHVRPDACGIATSGRVAFGEAKTWKDIDTGHTRKQLRAFAQLKHRGDRTPCRLYIAIPRSASLVLDRVLAEIGLLHAGAVVRLHIPDCLITENRK
jgi:hypothetical protein